jgi:hypothetical protein
LEGIGITLIDIPYWWDGSTESLKATICKYKPDLLTQLGHPHPTLVIPTEAPSTAKRKGVGE